MNEFLFLASSCSLYCLKNVHHCKCPQYIIVIMIVPIATIRVVVIKSRKSFLELQRSGDLSQVHDCAKCLLDCIAHKNFCSIVPSM